MEKQTEMQSELSWKQRPGLAFEAGGLPAAAVPSRTWSGLPRPPAPLDCGVPTRSSPCLQRTASRS